MHRSNISNLSKFSSHFWWYFRTDFERSVISNCHQIRRFSIICWWKCLIISRKFEKFYTKRYFLDSLFWNIVKIRYFGSKCYSEKKLLRHYFILLRRLDSFEPRSPRTSGTSSSTCCTPCRRSGCPRGREASRSWRKARCDVGNNLWLITQNYWLMSFLTKFSASRHKQASFVHIKCISFTSCETRLTIYEQHIIQLCELIHWFRRCTYSRCINIGWNCETSSIASYSTGIFIFTPPHLQLFSCVKRKSIGCV